jgi:hypothetical protein
MRRVPTMSDILAWFSEDERDVCDACGERACLGLPQILASFCLRCAAITLEGVRLDAPRACSR